MAPGVRPAEAGSPAHERANQKGLEVGWVAARILVIEDENNIANVVRIALERDGHQVVQVSDGEAGLSSLARTKFDLLVLDIGLPGVDGFEVCRRIRTRSNVPIIFLTARDEEIDRVLGLELGADDYLAKPFSPRELAARVKAILRRTQPASANDVLELGDVVLERSRHEVRAGGKEIGLTRKEFELLAFLMESPGVVISRDRLLEAVWDLTFPGGTRTVDQHVAQLRAKLGRPLIETVRGLGYRAVSS